LTPREIEVLRLVARHCTDKEIAAELALSPRTVMHHVSSILGKFGVATRREAAAWAARHGLD
jgi:DNA-binding CsgD family transcriptional regulator